ncbi:MULTISPECIES: hypothetical protein [Bacillus cereus group]|uniref:Uncharacterized protein n=1 Tax=Bacillus cereus TaxID=1396 RepID=A0A2A7HU66_BACCE|nr:MULTISPECIES: hypothetical protein [Bacillus cereus group]MED0989373.1 hypothetical protein [Bacillus nitratireducens]PEC20592.1 hypothetical protein COM96_18590 [Bacillus cereus]PEV99787.1 hypothetical protein CN425_18640 [Bacillus cereus]PFU42227.1 hypothetical protein COK86_13700 [Bacillus cereus]PGC41908.1 hypothetical protein COM18_09640 [Bacillus pseudomycoides]
METKQQRFYSKIKDFYGLDTSEDAKRLYNAYNQLKKIETVGKASKIDDMLTRLYAGKKLTD